MICLTIHLRIYKIKNRSMGYHEIWHCRILPTVFTCKIWGFQSGDYEECRLLGRGSSHLATVVLCSRIFLPWRWRRYVPPKRRLTPELHSATSQKTTFFTVFTCYNFVERKWKIVHFGWRVSICVSACIEYNSRVTRWIFVGAKHVSNDVVETNETQIFVPYSSSVTLAVFEIIKQKRLYACPPWAMLLSSSAPSAVSYLGEITKS
jgi:hypothetical protein